MAAPISIIIPAFNQLDYCRQCVTSVLANTRRPCKLILVDNGSTDGVSEYFDTVAPAEVIHSENNRGFAGGVNLGLERAEGHVVLLNSDTLTPEGWLGRLERALLSAEDVGMVGPMSNWVSGSQQIDGLSLGSMDEINAFARDLAQQRRGQLRDVARLVGFCLMVRDGAVRELGPFDESYGVGNFEDDDYCLRAIRAGYRLCVAEDTFVFHYGGRTFAGMGLTDEKWQGLIEENERRFFEKWHAAPAERSDAAQESKRLNKQARQAVESGDLVEAVALLTRAIEAYPPLEANHNDLGAVLWQMGERERALECFVRATKLNPAYAEARENLRDAAQALGRMAEVEELLSE